MPTALLSIAQFRAALTWAQARLQWGVFPAEAHQSGDAVCPPYCRRGSVLLEEAILKADVLIEALQWIRQFRDKITVIKLGGSVMEDERAMIHLLLDLVFMETVGMRPVVVHGGGAAISRAMAAAGLKPHFVQGRRYTDADTLAIVERVLAGEVNEYLARRIEELGGRAKALNFRTKNVLFGERIMLPDGNGGSADLGYVGAVTEVDRAAIEELCQAGVVPVIPSMCITRDGQKLNVNADTAATAVAQALTGGETGVPQRRQRGAPRQERSRLADPFAHRGRGP